MSAANAIVIGGSIAGLLTAQVLSDHFDQITVIERDRLPDDSEPRNGVPQSRHVHNLLANGLRLMESLLPGLTDDLLAAGALPLDWSKHTRLRTRGGWVHGVPTDVRSVTCSRTLLESVIRRRVLANRKITVIEGVQVEGLLAEDDRIAGVRLRGRAGTSIEGDCRADFVVDASGRASDAPAWLAALGFEQPTETKVDAFAGYATRLYRKPAGYNPPWHILFIMAQSPNLRGGAIFEIENGVWMVSLGGYNKDYPPTDEAGFIEYARSLQEDELYEAIKAAEPLSKVISYRRTANRIRHYERLTRFPQRFVLLGDAVCGFNPIYGHGMTAAVMGVEMLRALLPTHSLDTIGKPFQAALAKQNESIWLMATGEDFRFPLTEGERPGMVGRLLQKYIDQVLAAMPHDPVVANRFLQVMNLLQPPTLLFSPRVVAAVCQQVVGRGSPA
jgi:2-polyprenyl-6-methoxyphenol hydroxylase-like FAD-dependent oxidoreductase